MTTEAERLAVRYFEELFNERRADVAGEINAAAYVEHATAPFESVEPGAVHGPTLVGETVRWLVGEFPDLRFRIEAIVSAGDTVVARVIGEGTNLGAMGAMPPTGRRFSAASSHWFRVEAGSLAEHWATRDDLTTMIQLGLVPPRHRRG
jgi:predicted ester cyclase